MPKKVKEYNPLELTPAQKNILFGTPLLQKKSTKTTPPLSYAVARNIQQCLDTKCEIPRCQHPSQSVHHIKPREEQGKHTYLNLIALCDFHHTEANDGKIPRITLKNYVTKRSAARESCVQGVLKRFKK